MTTATHDIDESVSHIRQLLDTAKATQRPSDARLVDEALRMLEAEELLAVSERRVQIGYRLKGGVSHDALAKLRVWVDEAKRTQRSTDIDMVRGALTVIEAEETLAKIVERAERRRQTTSLPPGYTYVDATTLGHSIDDFAFKAPDGRVYGPYVNKASMHGDAWTHATDPDLFIAPTPGADELLTPEEYEAALASDLSETDLYHIIDRAMSEALELRSPFFRVSVPSVALGRAKVMLEKWDVRATGRPNMRERGGHLVHLKVSPKPPAFEVFLVGDVVVVAEDADNARLLTSSMTKDLRMIQLLMEGFESAEPRQVDSSDVLAVVLWDDDGPQNIAEIIEARAVEIYDGFEYDGIGEKPRWVPGGNSIMQDQARRLARQEPRTVTKTAGEWAKSSGRGVLGPLVGSAINHLYFIGPNLYVAESEEAALKYHHDGVIDNTAKLEELRRSILEEAPSEADLASRHVDAVFAEVNKVYVIRRIEEDESLPEIVEFSDKTEAVQVSSKTYSDWRRGKMGSVGLLRSYYQEVITPHVEAIMAAAAVAGERRLQEVREKLGIGDGL